jgi:hypothetical protein
MLCRYAECRYAEYRYAVSLCCCVVMLTVVMLGVIILSVVMLNVVAPCQWVVLSSTDVKTAVCLHIMMWYVVSAI